MSKGGLPGLPHSSSLIYLRNQDCLFLKNQIWNEAKMHERMVPFPDLLMIPPAIHATLPQTSRLLVKAWAGKTQRSGSSAPLKQLVQGPLTTVFRRIHYQIPSILSAFECRTKCY